ncbi:unnamed protein product [Leptosia nina]|uniref:peptidylprolyl isomerase n=1 Tax=Leptosia nina TaxID=320188 RepID=A0AAV1JM03_9NEOP
MEEQSSTLALDDGLDLRQLVTSSSILNINIDYNEFDNELPTQENIKNDQFDTFGKPLQSFAELEQELLPLDKNGYVKKKIIEDGGGLPLDDGCTVSIIYSGYWENEMEPFDSWASNKPLIINLKDNGLLPGLLMAVKSMLVGETAVFLLSHEVAYGELGVPPRIKPRAKCVFYVKLIKSILTPAEGPLDYSEPNSFKRVHNEVRTMYGSGVTFYKLNNYNAAIQIFRKGVNMLHKCRLANEEEELAQQKLLIKLYTNLAICYNGTKQPLKACTSCNELHRLGNLWNSSKVLYQNAKALRMIGQFEEARKKLNRAIKLSPDNKEIKVELELLDETSKTYSMKHLIPTQVNIIDDNFKNEVDNLIKNFKRNLNICKLTLPSGMNQKEIDYIKGTCIRENLFFNKIQDNYLLDKDERGVYEEKDCIKFM